MTMLAESVLPRPVTKAPRIEEHLGLVRVIARGFVGRTKHPIEEYDEYSDGLSGLWQAIAGWDFQRPFRLYARKCIFNSILNGRDTERRHRIRYHTVDQDTLDGFPHQLQEADHINVKLDEVLKPPAHETEEQRVNRMILIDYFLNGLSSREIAPKHGISHSWVLKRVEQALNDIRIRFAEVIR
jgi:RNA polymerase sigma factor (sigma-70 family)